MLCLSGLGSAGQEGDAAPPSGSELAVPVYDKRGIQRDTAYFLGYQFAAVGLISLWPEDETNYSNDISFERWLENVTHPQWDPDRAVVNYVLHPYWGAGYYIRARERGVGKAQAFWYSALLSTIYEYGAEAMVERVSYQDLVITPVLGSLLGEFVFSPLRSRIRAKEGPPATADQILLVLTDPLGSINAAVDGLFGVETQVVVGRMPPDQTWSRRFAATGGAHQPPGLHGGQRANWVVQLHVRW